MNFSILFELFLILIFKQAVNDRVSIHYETTLTIMNSFPIVSTLTLEGDQCSLEDAVNNCAMIFPIHLIIREQDFEKGIFVARLEYKDLPLFTRQQLEQRLYQFKSRINIQWNENYL